MDLKTTAICCSIKELMMDKYIDCVCNGNLKALSADGQGSDEDLQRAWRKIRSDYMEASADAQVNHMLATSWDAEAFLRMATAVKELLRWFAMVYDERFAETLRGLGYEYPFTEETYHDDIQHVLTEMECEQLRIKDKATEMSAGKPDVKPTEQFYYRTIVMLQKSLGIFPNSGPVLACRQMTVYEFITYCRMHNEMNNRQNPKQDGTGH